MRVISKNPKLPDFWKRHPDARAPLLAWYRETKHAAWKSFAELREASSATASQVGKFTVFNIGGNKYRLITIIHFNGTDPERGRVYVRQVLTHKDYDRGGWKDD